jgi:hypothetical protein
MKKHNVDPMFEYCQNCGKSTHMMVEDRSYECYATDNVVGISHIIAKRRFFKILGMGKFVAI